MRVVSPALVAQRQVDTLARELCVALVGVVEGAQKRDHLGSPWTLKVYHGTLRASAGLPLRPPLLCPASFL